MSDDSANKRPASEEKAKSPPTTSKNAHDITDLGGDIEIDVEQPRLGRNRRRPRSP